VSYISPGDIFIWRHGCKTLIGGDVLIGKQNWKSWYLKKTIESNLDCEKKGSVGMLEECLSYMYSLFILITFYLKHQCQTLWELNWELFDIPFENSNCHRIITKTNSFYILTQIELKLDAKFYELFEWAVKVYHEVYF